MPAEIINDDTTPYNRAQVHWGRDTQVQVSTVHHPDGDHPRSSGCCERHDWDGTFVTLDRAGCNRMIRALRKARDQAYGQDA